MDPLKAILESVDRKALWRNSRVFKRKEYLKTAGSIDQNIYFILSGSVRAYIMEDAEEQCIRFGYEGDILVSLDSYISGETSDLYIQALRSTEVKWMHRKDLMMLFTEEPQLLTNWHHLLEGLVLQQMEREKDLLTSSPVERFNRVMKRSPRLFQEIPHKYIASYLRMSPETLSRIQKS